MNEARHRAQNGVSAMQGNDAEFASAEVYTRRQLYGLIAGVVVLFIILLAPTPPELGETAKRVGAVATLMAIWWMTEAAPIPVTSLVPLVLFPILGIMNTKDVAPNYTDQIVFLFMGGFFIAAAMVKWNLHRRIALRTVLFFGTGPRRLIFGFICASAFVSLWINNTATTMMMLPIATAVVTQLSVGAKVNGVGGAANEESVRHNFGLPLMLAIAYGSSIGGVGTLIGTAPNGVFLGVVSRMWGDAAPEISFFQWMLVGVPVALLMLPIAWLIVTFIGPKIPLSSIEFGIGGRRIIIEELHKLGPMRSGERTVAFVFCITALLWIFRSPIDLGFFSIPGWSNFLGLEQYVSDATIAMGMGCLLFFLPVNPKSLLEEKKNGRFVLDWETAEDAIPWGILLLFGGGFALASGFASSGLSEYVGSRITLLGHVPDVVSVAVVCLIITFLTEMTSNTATTTMVLPILAASAVAMGQHPFLMMIGATISASCAFMLPVATPPNAIVFGSGWVTVPRMARTGFLLNLAGVAVITFMVMTMAMIAFGITPGQLPAWAESVAGR